MAQPLVQLPDGIANPSQLQWSQRFVDAAGTLVAYPVAQAASWFRAVGRSSTRWRNSSRRTNFTVCDTLVQLAKQCTDSKRSFLLVGNTRVTQTVKLVRLEEFLHLVEDLPTALNQLAA